MYIHTYIHLYITCIYSYIHTYITYVHYVHIHTNTYIHYILHTYMHTIIHTYIHTLHMYSMYTYIQILTYITYYIHIFIHTYMHTYIHSFMQACIYSQTHTYILNIHTFMLFNLEFAASFCHRMLPPQLSCLMMPPLLSCFCRLCSHLCCCLYSPHFCCLWSPHNCLCSSRIVVAASHLCSPRIAAYARLYPLSLLPQLLLIKHLQVCIRSTNIYTTYTCIHTCNRIHTYAHV